MATPNLYLPIKKASLCHWYECYKQQDLHNIQQLYYSTTPVRGIYAVTTDRRHYLVAIRPVNGKKDTETIFEAAKNSYNDANFRCQAAKVNQTTTHSLSNMFSSTATTLIGNDDNENRNNSGYSFTHLEHIKILEKAKTTHSKNDILHGTGESLRIKTRHFKTTRPRSTTIEYHHSSTFSATRESQSSKE
jgi:hypothetical protein